MGLKEYIDQLSDEEKLLHKDLIQESITREEETRAVDLKNQIIKLHAFNNNLDLFNKKVAEFQDTLKILNDELEKYHNANAPDENYYRYLN